MASSRCQLWCCWRLLNFHTPLRRVSAVNRSWARNEGELFARCTNISMSKPLIKCREFDVRPKANKMYACRLCLRRDFMNENRYQHPTRIDSTQAPSNNPSICSTSQKYLPKINHTDFHHHDVFMYKSGIDHLFMPSRFPEFRCLTTEFAYISRQYFSSVGQTCAETMSRNVVIIRWFIARMIRTQHALQLVYATSHFHFFFTSASYCKMSFMRNESAPLVATQYSQTALGAFFSRRPKKCPNLELVFGDIAAIQPNWIVSQSSDGFILPKSKVP